MLRCEFNSASGSAVAVHIDNDDNGEISNGDKIQLQNVDCGDATVEFGLDVTAAETEGSRVARLVGSAEFVAAVSANTAIVAETEGSFLLDRSSTVSETTMSLTDLVVASQHTLGAERLENARIDRVIAGLDYSLEFGGHIQSDRLGGSFDVAGPIFPLT